MKSAPHVYQCSACASYVVFDPERLSGPWSYPETTIAHTGDRCHLELARNIRQAGEEAEARGDHLHEAVYCEGCGRVCLIFEQGDPLELLTDQVHTRTRCEAYRVHALEQSVAWALEPDQPDPDAAAQAVVANVEALMKGWGT